MRYLLTSFFVCSFALGFAQQQEKITRHKYYYSIANVTDEQVLQQIVNEVNAYPQAQYCKYRLKPEKKMAEITFIYDEKPSKSEGVNKESPIPDLKKLIIEKGLTYNGFTQNEEIIIK